MNLPKYRETSDCEKFIYGFKELCEQTHMDCVTTCQLGLQRFKFADGSYIGIKPLLEEIGIYI